MAVDNFNENLSLNMIDKFYNYFVSKMKIFGCRQFTPELFSRINDIPLSNCSNNWWARGRIIGLGISHLVNRKTILQ